MSEEDKEMWEWLNTIHCVRCGLNLPYKEYVWCLSCRPDLEEEDER